MALPKSIGNHKNLCGHLSNLLCYQTYSLIKLARQFNHCSISELGNISLRTKQGNGTCCYNKNLQMLGRENVWLLLSKAFVSKKSLRKTGFNIAFLLCHRSCASNFKLWYWRWQQSLCKCPFFCWKSLMWCKSPQFIKICSSCILLTPFSLLGIYEWYALLKNKNQYTNGSPFVAHQALNIFSIFFCNLNQARHHSIFMKVFEIFSGGGSHKSQDNWKIMRLRTWFFLRLIYLNGIQMLTQDFKIFC